MPRGTDWNSISEPLAQSMDMVAQRMLRAPQIRYRLDQEARKLASQQMVDAAQAGNYNAQARGHTARAVGDEQKNAAFDRLNTGGGIAKLHGMISGTTPFDPAQYDQAMSDASLAFGVSGRDFIELLKQGAQSAAAKTGVPARANAEATGDITSIANNDADNKATAARGYSLSPGARRYDAAGNIIAENPSAASQREAEYESTTVEYPEVKGNKGTPATPAVQRSFMGIDALRKDVPANPGKPAIPGQPARKVTTRKRIGDFNAITAPAANQEQDPNDSEMMDETTMPAAQPAAAGKPLDAATAKQLLREAGGDKNKARELAKARGYTF
jgi:hypothetical protein